MIAPNMVDEKYKKMPKIAKAIYWGGVAVFLMAFVYFFL